MNGIFLRYLNFSSLLILIPIFMCFIDLELSQNKLSIDIRYATITYLYKLYRYRTIVDNLINLNKLSMTYLCSVDISERYSKDK